MQDASRSGATSERPPRAAVPSIAIVALAVSLAGCTGEIGDVRAMPRGPDRDLPPIVDGACDPTTHVAPATPLRRLTREEYNHTVQQLLDVTARPADAFPADESLHGFASGASVSPLQAELYVDAAPQNDPWAVFDALFGDFDAGAAELERRRRRQQSILDAVRGDVTELSGRLGREDRARLDSHLTSLRELERRLATAGGDRGAACEPPVLGTRIDPLRAASFPTIARLQIDLAVMAFACDQTRIGSLLFSGATSSLSFPWLGITQGHHDLSHEGDSNADAKDKLVRINRWYAEQIAYLLERLDSIPEGEGTMLDNTIVFWGNELSKGNNHSRNDMKFVVAGNAGGALRTGRFVRYAAVPHNNLLLTFANVMGVPATSFGAPEHCTGPLTDVT